MAVRVSLISLRICFRRPAVQGFSRLRRSRAARTSRTGRSIPLMQCSQHGEKCNEWFRTGPLRFEVTMRKVVPRQRRTLVTRNRYRLWKAELLLIPD
jgi:hypothetical protein